MHAATLGRSPRLSSTTATATPMMPLLAADSTSASSPAPRSSAGSTGAPGWPLRGECKAASRRWRVTQARPVLHVAPAASMTAHSVGISQRMLPSGLTTSLLGFWGAATVTQRVQRGWVACAAGVGAVDGCSCACAGDRAANRWLPADVAVKHQPHGCPRPMPMVLPRPRLAPIAPCCPARGRSLRRCCCCCGAAARRSGRRPSARPAARLRRAAGGQAAALWRRTLAAGHALRHSSCRRVRAVAWAAGVGAAAAAGSGGGQRRHAAGNSVRPGRYLRQPPDHTATTQGRRCWRRRHSRAGARQVLLRPAAPLRRQPAATGAWIRPPVPLRRVCCSRPSPAKKAACLATMAALPLPLLPRPAAHARGVAGVS